MLQQLKRYINWLLPPILGGSLYMIIFIAGQFDPEIFSWSVVVFEILIIGLLFFLVRKFLDSRYRKEGAKMLNWINFLIAFAIVLSTWFGLYILIKILLIVFTPQDDSISIWHIVLSLAQAVIVGITLVGIQFMWLFFEGWNKSNLRAAQLEKENAKARLASLKLQLNPHFLFNNFHTLDGLIHENQSEASSFLMELAALYRSILKYSDDEIILLEKEIELVRHFNFLMEKRFSKSYHCKIEVSEKVKQNFYVPPLAIQMLLENAVKHNRIDNGNPLKCVIEKEGDFIVVKNNLAPKTQIQKASGIGLKNLKRRYKMLSDLPIKIEKSSKEFKVFIPLIDAVEV